MDDDNAGRPAEYCVAGVAAGVGVARARAPCNKGCTEVDVDDAGPPARFDVAARAAGMGVAIAFAAVDDAGGAALPA